ncbi:MAG TPA: type II secretion system F family protein [Mycobacteriales bacterium]|nr:type II secretion system F family protein [Mycobacteriales bacterium]
MSTATFSYTVRDAKGVKVTGSLEADSEAAVARRLKSMGYAPIEITRANAGMQKELSIPGFGPKVKLKDLALFARQFATMINSGLSLLRAMTILVEQTENPLLQKTLREVRQDVEQGNALSAAMARFPDVFPNLMVNMIKAGEVGGFLDQTLLQIAENYEKEVKLRGKIKSAMTYPVVVFVMAILAITVMLIFVVPTFASIFSTLGGKLPAPTQLLVTFSKIVKIAIIPVVILLIAFYFVWQRIKREERVRRALDPLKLKIPVFGPLFQKVALARFTRNFGTMLRSGVPILQALDIVADTSGNIVIADAVRDVQNSVRQGESITAPLAQHEIFPAMVQQMMAVGEETGALDTMLTKIADFYDQEVEATSEQLTALIEPLMILFLGVVVGGMIIALYMPIFKVYDLVNS